MKNLQIIFQKQHFDHIDDYKDLHDLRLKQTNEFFEKMTDEDVSESLKEWNGKICIDYPDSEIMFVFNIDMIVNDIVYVSFKCSAG